MPKASSNVFRQFLVPTAFFAIIGVIVVQFFLLQNKTEGESTVSKSSTNRIIAITQIAPHPSLDEIRKGIMDVLDAKNLKKLGLLPVEIVFQNAQGNVTTAIQIAAKFVSLNPCAIIPITTPSAQSVYNLTKTTEIPVIFAGISDPASAKLLPTSQSPFLTGVSDAAPVQAQVQLMKDCFQKPKTLETVGIIFNPGEANSVRMVELMTQELHHYQIKVVQATANKTTEIASAVQSLVGKVSALYLPNDNTVISALEAVLKITREHKIPVFSSDPESVQRGCLAAIAPDQYAMGQQVGHLIVQVLKGKSIKDLPIEQAKKNMMVMNTIVAQELGFSLKDELLKRADHLIQPLT